MPQTADEADGLTRPPAPPSWPRRIAGTLIGLLAIVWVGSVAAVLIFAEHDGVAHGNAAVGQADAIVVLGAAQYAGRPSPVLKARVDHALQLWREGVAPLLVFTGGVGARDTTSEAAVSATYAMRRGVPEDSILLEAHGRTTSQSITAVAQMLSARQQTSVVLVSDPYHMFRLWILARRHGLKVITSPTRTSPIWASVPASAGYILSESIKAPVAFLVER